MPDLSDNLREYMRMQKISQAELSNRSNISKTQISKILKRKACPRIDTLKLICNALEIDISYLFKNDLYSEYNMYGLGGLNRMDKSVISSNSSMMESKKDYPLNSKIESKELSQDEVSLLNERKALIEFAINADLEQLKLVNQVIRAMSWDDSSELKRD